MTTITPNQDFKDDGNTYLKGQSYEVSDDLAAYFLNCGWVGEPQPPAIHSLDIQDGQLGHSSEV